MSTNEHQVTVEMDVVADWPRLYRAITRARSVRSAATPVRTEVLNKWRPTLTRAARSRPVAQCARRWSVRNAVAWICLALVVSITTYAVDLFSAALGPTPSAMYVTQTAANTAPPHDAAFVGLGVSPVGIGSWLTAWKVITITGRDPVTGERVQVQCSAIADPDASDVQVLDPDDFAAVVAGLCMSPP